MGGGVQDDRMSYDVSELVSPHQQPHAPKARQQILIQTGPAISTQRRDLMDSLVADQGNMSERWKQCRTHAPVLQDGA